MILADNGSNWYISGVPDSRWNDDTLVGELKLVKGSDFEAVDESSLMVDPDSGQVNTTTTTIVSSTTTTTSNPTLVLNKPNGGESWNRNSQTSDNLERKRMPGKPEDSPCGRMAASSVPSLTALTRPQVHTPGRLEPTAAALPRWAPATA